MKADPRNRELGRIHILKKDLGLDDDQYRVVLWTVARVDSSRDLDSHGRRQVIEHLESHVKARAKKFPNRPHNTDTPKRLELTKIEALLTDAGKPWAYAEAMAKRMCRKDRIAFCGAGDLAKIIAALEKQALKRLSAELETEFGWNWREPATALASMLFDFDAQRRTLESYSQPMSQVLRWYRGTLQAACTWPIDTNRPACCYWCQRRAQGAINA